MNLETFQLCEFEDECEVCHKKSPVYTRTSFEGETQGYWCEECATKLEEQEKQQGEWFDKNICNHGNVLAECEHCIIAEEDD